MANKIFLSYRRYDTAGTTGRLHDYLEDVFGKDRVFKDVSDIPAGVDFRKVLGKEILDSKIILIMIGKHYTSVTGEDGQPRLHNPNDFVHIEVATAINMKKIVIPVLVDGATMPRAGELPDDLKELVNYNAVILSHDRWKSDVKVLVEKLRYHLEPPRRETPPKTTSSQQVTTNTSKTSAPAKKSWLLPALIGVAVTLVILFVIGSMMEEVEAPNDPLALSYVYVDASALNVRNAPGTEDTKVLGEVYDGDQLKVIDEEWVGDTKWFKVETNRHKGWVSGNMVSEAPLSVESGGGNQSPREPASAFEEYDKPSTSYQVSNAELLIGTWQCYEINGMSLTAFGFPTNYFNFIFYNNGTMYSQITNSQHYYVVEGNNIVIDGQRGDVITYIDQHNLTISSSDNFGNPMLMRFRRI